MGDRKPFSLRLGTRQKCPLSPILLNIVFEVLARAVRQEKEIKPTKLERKTLNLFANGLILYIENSKEPTQKFIISEFVKVVGYKINVQNPLYFCALEMKNPKIRIQFHL